MYFQPRGETAVSSAPTLDAPNPVTEELKERVHMLPKATAPDCVGWMKPNQTNEHCGRQSTGREVLA